MSKRCLFFTTHEVFFFCHVGTKDATFYAESKPQDGVRVEYILPQFNSLWLRGSQNLDAILRGVWTAIADYNMRELSYSFDALNAFSGIMSIASNMFGLTFIYGLPEQALDESLLWYSWDEVKRNPYFPSWSWAGCIGQVGFLKEDVRTEIEISREHKKGKIPTELGVRSDGRIIAQPEILCFSTTKAKASQFFLFQEDAYVSIRTRAGLRCGYVTDAVDFPLSIKSDQSSFVLLSRSNREHWLCCVRDRCYYGVKPWTGLNVLLVEQKGEYYERIRLCQIHEEAWLAADPQPALIKLA